MFYGIITGLIAGYIASLIQKGRGSGCLMNIIIGVIGGFFGGWLFSLFDMSPNSWIGEIIVSVVGACLLLWLYRRLS